LFEQCSIGGFTELITSNFSFVNGVIKDEKIKRKRENEKTLCWLVARFSLERVENTKSSFNFWEKERDGNGGNERGGVGNPSSKLRPDPSSACISTLL